jgi:HEAT repeat protein
VPVRASSAIQIDSLIADLSGVSDVKRDAAVARLSVIGARAVERLVELGQSGSSPLARVAAFRALEAIGDARALDAALRATGDRDAGVATAAVGVARVFIHGEYSVRVVDRLTGVSLDQRRPDAVRVAAVRALRELDHATVAPLMKSLLRDRSEAVRSEAVASRESADKSAGDPAAALARVAEGSLPDDAATVKRLVIAAADTAPLPVLLKIVERVRERETSEPRARRAAWTTARAAAHLALARRDSRLAVYDLRESLEKTAEPLPVDMLAALEQTGDASCLEPIASAYERATDAWWRDHLKEAFDAIVARERLTARHALIKKIRAKHNWAGRAGGAGKVAGRSVGHDGLISVPSVLSPAGPSRPYPNYPHNPPKDPPHTPQKPPPHPNPPPKKNNKKKKKKKKTPPPPTTHKKKKNKTKWNKKK